MDKPAGLLTVGTSQIKAETLYYKLTEYVRKGNARSRERVFIVHRLDREASGLLVFARQEQAKYTLQSHWPDAVKKYLAVVEGAPSPRENTITSYLAENAAHNVYAVAKDREGKLSHTRYRVMKEKNALSLLEIELLTGRKHQIRVHLAGIGHPIIGDRKYGRGVRGDKRLALHACLLSFDHPVTGERLTFTTPVPKYFTDLVGAVSMT